MLKKKIKEPLYVLLAGKSCYDPKDDHKLFFVNMGKIILYDLIVINTLCIRVLTSNFLYFLNILLVRRKLLFLLTLSRVSESIMSL